MPKRQHRFAFDSRSNEKVLLRLYILLLKPDHVMQLVDDAGIIRELELPNTMRLQPVRSPDALHRARADTGHLRHHGCGPVSGLGWGGGLRERPRVPQRPRRAAQCAGGGPSRSRPSKPSCAKHSCQRQTQVLDLPVRRLISLVPTPSALNNTISARQTCFCGALRSRTSASKRKRSEQATVMEIPVRMPQIRTQSAPGGIPSGIQMRE
jgi:hypothetical protein